VPESWKNAVDEEVPVKKEEPEFVKKIQRVMARNEGDELPVSAFWNGGRHTSVGTTAYEKRGIAPMIPNGRLTNVSSADSAPLYVLTVQSGCSCSMMKS